MNFKRIADGFIASQGTREALLDALESVANPSTTLRNGSNRKGRGKLRAVEAGKYGGVWNTNTLPILLF